MFLNVEVINVFHTFNLYEHNLNTNFSTDEKGQNGRGYDI